MTQEKTEYREGFEQFRKKPYLCIENKQLIAQILSSKIRDMNKLIEILSSQVIQTIIEPPYEYHEIVEGVERFIISIHKEFSYSMLNEIFLYERTNIDIKSFREKWEEDKKNLIQDLAKILINFCNKEGNIAISIKRNDLLETEWAELFRLIDGKCSFVEIKELVFKDHKKIEIPFYFIQRK